MLFKDLIQLLISIPLLSFILIVSIQIIKKDKNIKHWLMLLAVFILLIPKTSNYIVKAWYLDDTIRHDVAYDGVVVLTGITHNSWHYSDRSKLLPNYLRFGNNEGFRIGRGVELIKTNMAQHLFIGDLQINDYNEAQVLKSFAVRNGVPKNKVVIYGSNVKGTYDEARQFYKSIKKNQLENVILVTSAIHMRRASAAFRKQGINADLVSINRESIVEGHPYIPRTESLIVYECVLYEIIGYVGYFLKGYV
jgi:uncharacterized SAM-binding protein YcdF (DUF218 family)